MAIASSSIQVDHDRTYSEAATMYESANLAAALAGFEQLVAGTPGHDTDGILTASTLAARPTQGSKLADFGGGGCKRKRQLHQGRRNGGS